MVGNKYDIIILDLISGAVLSHYSFEEEEKAEKELQEFLDLDLDVKMIKKSVVESLHEVITKDTNLEALKSEINEEILSHN